MPSVERSSPKPRVVWHEQRLPTRKRPESRIRRCFIATANLPGDGRICPAGSTAAGAGEGAAHGGEVFADAADGIAAAEGGGGGE